MFGGCAVPLVVVGCFGISDHLLYSAQFGIKKLQNF